MGKQKKAVQLSTSADPPVDDAKREETTPPEAKERRLSVRGQDPNATRRTEDHIYGIESRARWPSGDVSELHRDSMAIDGVVTNGGTGGDGTTSTENDDTIEPEKMTVPELKHALDQAGVAYTSDDKKADLVALYSDYLAEQQAE